MSPSAETAGRSSASTDARYCQCGVRLCPSDIRSPRWEIVWKAKSDPGQLVEVGPGHRTAPALDLPDQLEKPLGQRSRHAVALGLLERRAQVRLDLGLALADHQVPPDARLGLRVPPVERRD